METSTVTDYEIFTKIRNHLLNQNERSMNQVGDCGYFGLKESVKDEIRKDLRDRHMIPLLDEDGEIIDDDEYREWEHEETIEEAFSYALEKFVLYDCDDSKLMRCAVGAIIDFEFYDFGIEGSSISENAVLEAVQNSNPNWQITLNGVKMLECLQNTHDKIVPKNWAWFLSKISEFFDGDGNFAVDSSTAYDIMFSLENQFKAENDGIRPSQYI